MLNLPTDPMALNDRLIAAFCRDLGSAEFCRDGSTPETDAVAEIARTMRAERVQTLPVRLDPGVWPLLNIEEMK